ncbi:MAG: glycosyltransferase family 2 protein, partial [Candidatus Sericytochromatia bacterium]|nr:glycosyltransferase family 2 protein [Candidatus Sericytochromatia bacterium]
MPGKLSVCMIVRDEADVLPRCLASVAGFADEIIAVDTGSTDGSQEILRAAGAQVFEIPWPNDFGEARTAALRYATGDWVLFIDADEAVDEARAKNVRLLMVDIPQPVSFEVPILSYMDEDESGETALSWMPRLFNQPQQHFFYGRLHEQLIGSKPVRLDPTVLRLYHWGYQKSRVDAKGKEERNIALLTTEAGEHDGDSLRVELYLAAGANDPHEILTHARAALALIPPELTAPAPIVTVCTLIIRGHIRLAQWTEATSQAEALLVRFPMLENEAQYWHLVGEAHRGQDDFTGAEQAYRRAVDLVSENRVLQSFWNEIVPANASLALAGLLARRGAQAEAQQVLEAALARPGLGRDTRARLQGALSSTFAGTNMLESAWD